MVQVIEYVTSIIKNILVVLDIVIVILTATYLPL